MGGTVAEQSPCVDILRTFAHLRDAATTAGTGRQAAADVLVTRVAATLADLRDLERVPARMGRFRGDLSAQWALHEAIRGAFAYVSEVPRSPSSGRNGTGGSVAGVAVPLVTGDAGVVAALTHRLALAVEAHTPQRPALAETLAAVASDRAAAAERLAAAVPGALGSSCGGSGNASTGAAGDMAGVANGVGESSGSSEDDRDGSGDGPKLPSLDQLYAAARAAGVGVTGASTAGGGHTLAGTPVTLSVAYPDGGGGEGAPPAAGAGWRPRAARLRAHLRHPNLVTLYGSVEGGEAGVDGDPLTVHVASRVPGEVPLDALLRGWAGEAPGRGGRGSGARTATAGATKPVVAAVGGATDPALVGAKMNVLLDVASGLAYLHAADDAVHGGVCPANVLVPPGLFPAPGDGPPQPITRDGSGAGVRLAGAAVIPPDAPPPLLLPGAAVGGGGRATAAARRALPYAAPEVVRKAQPSPAADVWSWGMLAVALFSAADPYAAAEGRSGGGGGGLLGQSASEDELGRSASGGMASSGGGSGGEGGSGGAGVGGGGWGRGAIGGGATARLADRIRAGTPPPRSLIDGTSAPAALVDLVYAAALVAEPAARAPSWELVHRLRSLARRSPSLFGAPASATEGVTTFEDALGEEADEADDEGDDAIGGAAAWKEATGGKAVRAAALYRLRFRGEPLRAAAHLAHPLPVWERRAMGGGAAANNAAAAAAAAESASAVAATSPAAGVGAGVRSPRGGRRSRQTGGSAAAAAANANAAAAAAAAAAEEAADVAETAAWNLHACCRRGQHAVRDVPAALGWLVRAHRRAMAAHAAARSLEAEGGGGTGELMVYQPPEGGSSVPPATVEEQLPPTPPQLQPPTQPPVPAPPSRDTSVASGVGGGGGGVGGSAPATGSGHPELLVSYLRSLADAEAAAGGWGGTLGGVGRPSIAWGACGRLGAGLGLTGGGVHGGGPPFAPRPLGGRTASTPVGGGGGGATTLLPSFPSRVGGGSRRTAAATGVDPLVAAITTTPPAAGESPLAAARVGAVTPLSDADSAAADALYGLALATGSGWGCVRDATAAMALLSAAAARQHADATNDLGEALLRRARRRREQAGTLAVGGGGDAGTPRRAPADEEPPFHPQPLQPPAVDPSVGSFASDTGASGDSSDAGGGGGGGFGGGGGSGGGADASGDESEDDAAMDAVAAGDKWGLSAATVAASRGGEGRVVRRGRRRDGLHLDAATEVATATAAAAEAAGVVRRAATAFLIAESLGSVAATVNRGLLLADPRSPSASDTPAAATAYAFFEAAARAGAVHGLYLTGVALSRGVGVAAHPYAAYERLAAAAAAGHGDAALATARALRDGVGTAPSAARATGWLRAAAAAGVPAAAAELAAALATGGGAVGDADERGARRLAEAAAAAGDPDAMALLAGLVESSSPARAVGLWAAAAAGGCGSAALALGDRYAAGGGGLPRDVRAAAAWYRAAAAAGEAGGTARLRRRGFRLALARARNSGAVEVEMGSSSAAGVDPPLPSAGGGTAAVATSAAVHYEAGVGVATEEQ
ncbi:hypothetical protein MMPV_003797 [Pyropia vietnamensis]